MPFLTIFERAGGVVDYGTVYVQYHGNGQGVPVPKRLYRAAVVIGEWDGIGVFAPEGGGVTRFGKGVGGVKRDLRGVLTV